MSVISELPVQTQERIPSKAKLNNGVIIIQRKFQLNTSSSLACKASKRKQKRMERFFQFLVSFFVILSHFLYGNTFFFSFIFDTKSLFSARIVSCFFDILQRKFIRLKVRETQKIYSMKRQMTRVRGYFHAKWSKSFSRDFQNLSIFSCEESSGKRIIQTKETTIWYLRDNFYSFCKDDLIQMLKLQRNNTWPDSWEKLH